MVEDFRVNCRLHTYLLSEYLCSDDDEEVKDFLYYLQTLCLSVRVNTEERELMAYDSFGIRVNLDKVIRQFWKLREAERYFD